MEGCRKSSPAFVLKLDKVLTLDEKLGLAMFDPRTKLSE